MGRAQKKADRVKLLRQTRAPNYPESKASELYVDYPELKASELFVDNLEVSVDDRKLEEIFSGLGKVASANVMRGRDGVSKGCGFVRFTSSDDAMKAMHLLNGKPSLLFPFLFPFISLVTLSPNLTSVWFFLGTNILGKTLYVSLVLYDAERVQDFRSKYPPQPFYTQNLDVVTSELQPLHYNFLNTPPWDHTTYQNFFIPQLNSWDPILRDDHHSFTAYQNFGRTFSSFYGAQNHKGNLFTNVRIFHWLVTLCYLIFINIFPFT